MKLALLRSHKGDGEQSRLPNEVFKLIKRRKVRRIPLKVRAISAKIIIY